MRKMPLKVFCLGTSRGSRELTYYVAATSKKEAARLFCCTVGNIDDYGGQVDGSNGYGDLEVCFANPGVVYRRDRDFMKDMPLEVEKNP